MKTYLSIVVLSLLLWNAASGQGCSDAGVCTIHSFKNNTHSEENKKLKNEIVVGFGFGKGERSINYYTQYVEYTRSLTERTSITGKFVYNFISGELARTNGPGDLFLSVNHALQNSNAKWQKAIVFGVKIPFDKADIIKNQVHLPMPYQASLGTTDIVAGINLARKSLGITVAVQQPISATNDNRFLPEDYSSVPLAYRYLPTNRFERKGDALLRVSYAINKENKLSFRPSLLTIYHLGNDTYKDASKTRRTIDKSAGFTLNANLFVDYQLNKKSQFELSLGTPFVVRTNRPDGLTRSFVASLEYKINF